MDNNNNGISDHADNHDNYGDNTNADDNSNINDNDGDEDIDNGNNSSNWNSSNADNNTNYGALVWQRRSWCLHWRWWKHDADYYDNKKYDYENNS